MLTESPVSTRMLLDRGASVNARDLLGRTPLMWAARNRRTEIVQMLLDHGAG
jgi:ankyrin repeat protein